jgi:hypothetical protein
LEGSQKQCNTTATEKDTVINDNKQSNTSAGTARLQKANTAYSAGKDTNPTSAATAKMIMVPPIKK